MSALEKMPENKPETDAFTNTVIEKSVYKSTLEEKRRGGRLRADGTGPKSEPRPIAKEVPPHRSAAYSAGSIRP